MAAAAATFAPPPRLVASTSVLPTVADALAADAAPDSPLSAPAAVPGPDELEGVDDCTSPFAISPCGPPLDLESAMARSSSLLQLLPPMEGSVKYKRAWSIEEALEQHQSLMRQHELQSTIGFQHTQVMQLHAQFARIHAHNSAALIRDELKTLLGDNSDAPPPCDDEAASSKLANLQQVSLKAAEAAQKLKLALQMRELQELRASSKTEYMEAEIAKSNTEMVVLREAIDDVGRGGGPKVNGLPSPPTPAAGDAERKFFYCSDCHVGGHGQRFCNYLLKRPNWRVYPSEKWFEDKSGQSSYCPLGRRGVDFTDETYFSRIAMHIKGRIWLEDKRKLYEFVPDIMPKTFIIVDQRWIGDPPPAEPPDAAPWPWFVKETDRNWGTSVQCCMRPEECMGLTKPNAAYVVQKHIPDPMLMDDGCKFHIKFYNMIYGMEDGRRWRLYTYGDGYLCISPRKWSPTDLSKEGQVTIIRTRRISSWDLWPEVYPKCQSHMKTVIERAVQQGKLEGRDKKQFEIISADFVVTSDQHVFLLEFNSGPVLRDPEDSPGNNDAGMINGALHIVEPWEEGDEDKWDFVVECCGPPLPTGPAHGADGL